jgi:imidazolonepropionase-like amidohydrolase
MKLATIGLSILAFGVSFSARAQQQAAPSGVLFENVRIFDGTATRLSVPSNVLVVGNSIKSTSTGSISTDGLQGITTIAGNGRTLMPGMIDAHAHIMMAAIPMQVAMTADIGYINLVAAKGAERTLMRGFTSIRDMGGPAFRLKRAIDQGLFPGTRIYPSGAFISQTGGHGDFRMPYEVPQTAILSAIWRGSG